MLHLLGQGQLGHLLQARIEGQLQTQIVAVEHPRSQAIGQGGAIGTAAHLAQAFMAAQVLVAALLQAGLGHPLQVEEADHIGEQGAQGVNPLGVGLQIQATDAQLANAMGRFRIQFAGQLHSGLSGAYRGHQRVHGKAQDRGELLGHIEGRALAVRRIGGEIEVARMGPNGEALLIEGHHATGAIDDRAPLTDRRNRLGLHGPGPVEQLGPLDHLDPGQAHRQPHQAGGKDEINGQQPDGRNGSKVEHPAGPRSAWALGRPLPGPSRHLASPAPVDPVCRSTAPAPSPSMASSFGMRGRSPASQGEELPNTKLNAQYPAKIWRGLTPASRVMIEAGRWALGAGT